MFKNQKISLFSALFTLIFALGFFWPSSFASAAICEKDSTLFLSLQDASAKPAGPLYFEVYEQNNDNSLSTFGDRVGSGRLDDYGQGKVSFKPDSSKTYALKVWDKNSERGDFRFFDAIRFSCSSDRYLTKQIPSLTILLRGLDGELKKDFSFSLYVQKFDSANKPYFDDNSLIGNFRTNASGEFKIFLSSYNSYINNQNGFYALNFKDQNDNQVKVFGLSPHSYSDKVFEYRFAGLSANLKNAASEVLADREIKLYEQITPGKMGEELTHTKSDSYGYFSFENSAGNYVVSVLDDFKREDFFWNNNISSGLSAEKVFRLNLSRFQLVDAQGEDLPDNPYIEIYALEGSGPFTKGERIGSLKLDSSLRTEASLAAGKYLVVYNGQNGKEYGQAFEALQGRLQNIKVMINEKYIVKSKSFTWQDIQNSAAPSSPIKNQNSSNSSVVNSVAKGLNLKGRILLQVEAKGEAWYVNPLDGKRYFLGRPQDAYDLMRRFGLGISNANFSSLSSNPGAYSSLTGRILLKVEDNGRAYYFDPVDLKLYYLGRPQDAFNIIRSRGLGITNENIDKINPGN